MKRGLAWFVVALAATVMLGLLAMLAIEAPGALALVIGSAALGGGLAWAVETLAR